MRRVLVVDDLEQNRYLLVSLLSGHGYQVAEASNGEQAWASAQQDPPHLIVSDLLMPVLDGFELCRRCKGDPRLAAVPFLVYTATYTDPRDEQLALSLGADRFLVKPQPPEVLMQVVHELLEGAGRSPPPRSDQGSEGQLLAHNEALVRKLQEKVQQLQREVHRREESERALRQSELRFRLLAESARDVVWSMDLDGRLTYVSPSIKQRRGFTPDEVLGLTLETRLPPDAARAVRRDLDAVRQDLAARGDSGRHGTWELTLPHKDGSTGHFEVGFGVLRDDGGKVVGLQGVTRDVTERKRAEAEIRRLNQDLEARVLARTEEFEAANRALGQQRDRLELLAGELRAQNDELARQKARLAEAHRLQSTFVSSMTHELRTPLNSVITLSALLSRRLAASISKEEHGYLDVIERNGRALLETINAVLDYARLEAGREQPHPERFELAPLVQELVAMLEPQAREKGLTVAVVLPGELPALHADRGMCRHILQNLLANAVKFTDQGRVEVRAAATAGQVRVAVSDTGIGIAPELHQVIFDEFRQGDESTARQYGGTGLGLAIARRYATLLGATIELDSVPGQGSTFTLALPLLAVPR